MDLSRASRAHINAVTYESTYLIKKIPYSLLDGVQKLVIESVEKGRDLGGLQRNLLARYDITERRAVVIARDQNNKATQGLAHAKLTDAGVTKGIWIHLPASRKYREEHVEMNGKEFDLAIGLYDKKVQKYVLPAECVNCRCTFRAVLPTMYD
jgi:uncharacterized protein with gpF-like domain